MDCPIKLEYAYSVVHTPSGSQPLLMIQLEYPRDVGFYAEVFELYCSISASDLAYAHYF